jgi:hypothetical protein
VMGASAGMTMLYIHDLDDHAAETVTSGAL